MDEFSARIRLHRGISLGSRPDPNKVSHVRPVVSFIWMLHFLRRSCRNSHERTHRTEGYWRKQNDPRCHLRKLPTDDQAHRGSLSLDAPDRSAAFSWPSRTYQSQQAEIGVATTSDHDAGETNGAGSGRRLSGNYCISSFHRCLLDPRHRTEARTIARGWVQDVRFGWTARFAAREIWYPRI